MLMCCCLLAGAAATALRARGDADRRRDTPIGGICLRFGLPLATRNVAHVSRVERLVLADLAA
jgi:predicted nucleic acid-binding protein